MARVMQNGDVGSDVAGLQKSLNEEGYGPLDEDGIFGSNTESAVRAYQSEHGLKVDGKVGPSTSNSLWQEDRSEEEEELPDGNRNLSRSKLNDFFNANRSSDDGNPSQFKQPPEDPATHKDILESAGYLDGAQYARTSLMDQFNATHRVMQDIHAGYEFSYVFITRPDLNLFDGDMHTLSSTLFTNNENFEPGLTDSQDLKMLVEDNRFLATFLDSSIPTFPGRNPKFIIPMTNLLKEMSSTDVEFSVKSSPANKQGISIDYPTNYIESMAGVPMTLTFQNDKWDTILKLIHIWTMYMSFIQKGYIRPRAEAIMKNKFESSVSIYQFVTGEDGETIKYWSKAVGAYPQGIPYSSKSHKPKRKIAGDDLSIPFYVPFFIAMRPSILADFNQLVGFEKDDPDPKSWNGLPISHREKNNFYTDSACIVKEDGQYKLRFYNPDNPGI